MTWATDQGFALGSWHELEQKGYQAGQNARVG